MQLRCVIGSLRLGDGTEYSKGDIFSLDDRILLQTFLEHGYVEEVKPLKVVKPVVEATPLKRKKGGKRKYGINNKL